MAQGMNAPLYSTEILRLAAALPDPQSLDHIDASGEARSPTCGSRCRVEVQFDGEGRIERLSQAVHACAFGQASAGLVAAHAPGRGPDEVRAALGEIIAWLAGDRPDPGAWPGLAALAPVRGRPGRHGAVILPFKALVAAFESIGR